MKTSVFLFFIKHIADVLFVSPLGLLAFEKPNNIFAVFNDNKQEAYKKQTVNNCVIHSNDRQHKGREGCDYCGQTDIAGDKIYDSVNENYGQTKLGVNAQGGNGKGDKAGLTLEAVHEGEIVAQKQTEHCKSAGQLRYIIFAHEPAGEKHGNGITHKLHENKLDSLIPFGIPQEKREPAVVAGISIQTAVKYVP